MSVFKTQVTTPRAPEQLKRVSYVSGDPDEFNNTIRYIVVPATTAFYA